MDENLTRAQVVETINIGEEISILTKTGETFNLTVKELNQDAIIGVKKTVKFDDIETIDNQQFSALNTKRCRRGLFGNWCNSNCCFLCHFIRIMFGHW